MESRTDAGVAYGEVADTPVRALHLRAPYLLFLGEETSPLKAKTAFGLRDWAPERCLAQLRMPGCSVDLGLSDMDPRSAAQAGATSLLIGVTPPGGRIQPAWSDVLRQAVDAGLDIVSGLHTALESVPGLAAAARAAGVALVDVRRPPDDLPRATGRRRSGRRVLAVGTDCALGKKYTALALARAMRAAGVNADFRATGQTGVMIAGRGIAIDAVIADFIAGAAECIAPAAAPDHWDVIEGQGSLFHPAYAGVTLGLVHGAQADALVLCHDPARARLVSWSDYPVRALRDAVGPYLEAARLTNPGARIAAVSLNTSALPEAEALQAIEDAARALGVPAFDPMRTPAGPVLDAILA
ncbi:DUF1611 domain-containing protein [Luteimonas sp. XNQY3]|nr:DUF1611 domain-containing protein [Luteimonas sp. XNQY3]MCD9007899.1 DUF1611 domain-containing protein [Luteimonas sp. XNQY3]